MGNNNESRSLTQNSGLGLGIIFFVALLIFPVAPDHSQASAMAAVAALMATWWMTEAIPLAATSLLPMVLFPALSIQSGGKTAPVYFNSTIFLFMGGFILALAMERWNLHKRVSLVIIRFIGTGPRGIITGFMAASWIMSMFISNTATTIMMMPIGLAIIKKMEEDQERSELRTFSVALMLGIAYSASVGGISTLIGTPPNLVFQKIFSITFNGAPEITFGKWMVFALPLSIITLAILWVVMTQIFFRPSKKIRIDKSIVDKEYKQLGKITFEEKALLVTLTVTALLWIFREDIVLGGFTIPGWAGLTPFKDYIDDSTVAIFMSLVLFLIPAMSRDRRGKNLLSKKVFSNIPWNIILLFGGGFALASGFESTGLSKVIGNQFSSFSGVSPILLILITCLVLTFLTELTSNTATTQTLLPILASVAVALQINPMVLMVPATISASYAFMLPVATPPNAIVFGSDRIRISDMSRVGVFLNLIGAVVVTLVFYYWGTFVYNIDITQIPSWIK